MPTSNAYRSNEEIGAQLDRIERTLLATRKTHLTMDEAALYLGYSKSHLYKLTCSHVLPYSKPQGKVIYFAVDDLNNYMAKNRINSSEESEQQAAAYIVAHPTPTTRRKGGKQ